MKTEADEGKKGGTQTDKQTQTEPEAKHVVELTHTPDRQTRRQTNR